VRGGARVVFFDVGQVPVIAGLDLVYVYRFLFTRCLTRVDDFFLPFVSSLNSRGSLIGTLASGYIRALPLLRFPFLY
jgi:hypothetical protein